ncbi:response regulator transcription factor [Paenibacillus apiarius]|uniref:Response regulator transcription factor n=1 Tax=Paenibacillus apiarius TaxID=46240 RepID=A0ABT4DP90_9BACL|nr:response regulator transcription factor [Paenibacillus apiarius]MCY9517238.1 response regulator transcription factor [Paenibacillus apiarius]MCY9519167.1 response regulator transcription factor [Paenibacillus apiarius]MCY9551050.1 response regulator transcription factor [Paenibacillus apiarius]MCY9560037.1 response regulator transcription factor [Paenibacillus apiarius]MCY9683320.1 response regulator transcription factor [Paenibacillus apiarius]
MNNGHILIIEDEVKIARVIKLELEHEGYTVDIEHSGTEGLRKYNEGQWDLVLLDVMLPGLNGLEVLRRIRAAEDLTPIILITARDSVPDKVSGLDMGANDYITKPFQIEELLARIRACLRIRQQLQKDVGQQEGLLEVADLALNEKSRTVTRQHAPIELTAREFDLLLFLMKHANQVLNREQIVSHVWGYDFVGDTNVVDVYIRYLRKKIDYEYSPPLIHTVRGVGYVLKE